MQFTQHVVVTTSDEEALLRLMREWEEDDAATDAPGYLGGRLFRFRDKPGRYVIEADFESWEAAEANNDRPETQKWAARLNDLIDGEPKYENLDVLGEF
jgi:quinol monooxygenase YgiN